MTPYTVRPWRIGIIGVAALAVFAFSVATLYPGWYSFDTSWQLWQARNGRFSDLQPPGMAFAWSVLLAAGLPPGSLLVAHLAALAAGTALLGISVRRLHGLALPLVLLWPPFLVTFGHLWNDVSLAAALALATGWISWTRATGRPAWGWLAAIPLAYAIGVRHNAVLAAPPLIFLLLVPAPASARRAASGVVLAIALSAGVFAGWAVVSRWVVTIPSPVLNVLAIWDLSATSVESGELLLPEGVYGPGLTVDELRPLVKAGTVYYVVTGTRNGINPGFAEPLPPAVERELRMRWLSLPFTHPVGWLRHRLAMAWLLFGPQRPDRGESDFIVPVVIDRPGNPVIVANDSPANAWLLGTVRAWRPTVAGMPLAYLLLSVLACALALRRGFGGDRGLVLALAAGAWLVALPLAIFSASAEWRYLTWPMMSSALALLLALDGGRRSGETDGGGCEIRTHEQCELLPVFKTGALNRSANPPARR